MPIRRPCSLALHGFPAWCVKAAVLAGFSTSLIDVYNLYNLISYITFYLLLSVPSPTISLFPPFIVMAMGAEMPQNKPFALYLQHGFDDVSAASVEAFGAVSGVGLSCWDRRYRQVSGGSPVFTPSSREEAF